MIKIIRWIVIKWKQLWRTIWFNTANIVCKNKNIDDAVYKINIILDWKIFKWAWSYRKNLWLFESHIFNFNEDIYWKKIEIFLFDKIRDNKKIENIAELKKIIEKDIKKIKSINNTILTFWTFDIVHSWHKYFLKQAKKYWDKLITILATDKNIEKIKWEKPFLLINKRIEEVKNLKISDKVLWWDETNPLIWLEIFKPKIICLWYDQVWYSENLIKYIKEKKLNIEVIRLKPFKEKIYKSSILKIL